MSGQWQSLFGGNPTTSSPGNLGDHPPPEVSNRRAVDHSTPLSGALSDAQPQAKSSPVVPTTSDRHTRLEPSTPKPHPHHEHSTPPPIRQRARSNDTIDPAKRTLVVNVERSSQEQTHSDNLKEQTDDDQDGEIIDMLDFVVPPRPPPLALAQIGYDLRPTSIALDRSPLQGDDVQSETDDEYNPTPCRSSRKRNRLQRASSSNDEGEQRPARTFVPTDARPHLTCANCRRNRKSCSIRHVNAPIPCASCRESNLECTFEAVQPPNKRTKHTHVGSSIFKARKDKPEGTGFNSTPALSDQASSHATAAGEHSSHPSATNDNQPLSDDECASAEEDLSQFLMTDEDRTTVQKSATTAANQSKQTVTENAKPFRIDTSFCHPINFDYIPPSLSISGAKDHQCHFCYGDTRAVYYSMFGVSHDFRKRPLVIKNADHKGYTEMKGGWRERGHAETRMCERCVGHRTEIRLCTEHEVCRIKGVDLGTDHGQTLEKLIWEVTEWKTNGRTPQPKPHYNDKRLLKDLKVHWCSICPYPASYECCTSLDGMPGGNGCGLKLCTTCANLVLGREPPAHYMQSRGRRSGIKGCSDLSSLIHFAAKDSVNYPDGLRADVEFLTEEGELAQRYPTFGRSEQEVLARIAFLHPDEGYSSQERVVEPARQSAKPIPIGVPKRPQKTIHGFIDEDDASGRDDEDNHNEKVLKNYPQRSAAEKGKGRAVDPPENSKAKQKGKAKAFETPRVLSEMFVHDDTDDEEEITRAVMQSTHDKVGESSRSNEVYPNGLFAAMYSEMVDLT